MISSGLQLRELLQFVVSLKAERDKPLMKSIKYQWAIAHHVERARRTLSVDGDKLRIAFATMSHRTLSRKQEDTLSFLRQTFSISSSTVMVYS